MVDKVLAGPVSGSYQDKAFQEKMRKTCADFESLFITYMMKSMRAGIAKAGAENSHEKSVMYSMLDEKLGEEIAESGGIGLADVLYDRLMEQKKIEAQRVTTS
jgi:flagellar protein FlgJ